MSDSNVKKRVDESKDDLPSNEELVDSLVEGLESDSIKLEDQNVMENASKENIDVNDKDSGDESATSEQAESKEEDEIDEIHLKDMELTYTDEDRLRLKEEATLLKNDGNNNFKLKEYEEAASCYTKALRICPISLEKERSILYANRGAAKMKLNRNVSAIEDCSKAVELDSQYLKAYLRRAQLYEETDKLDEALADYQKVLEIDPLHNEALFASKRLPDEINERNEKLKTEMLGKLKDLGNMFLKPFGLSTNNFQMVQDPNSGGYSINFTQNPNKS